jgi:predicted GNAT family N-acyltransferase
MHKKQDLQDPKYKPEAVLSDQRCLRRIPVRENEGVRALLSFSDASASNHFKVVDISSMGFCIESEEPIAHRFSKDDSIDFTLSCWDDSFRFICAICHITMLDQDRVRLGLLRTCSSREKQFFDHLPDKISLTATTHHPYYYNEDVIVRITGISPKDCVLECDDPEFLVLPSMPILLELHISFERHDKIAGQVTWVETPDHGKTRFGLEIRQISDKTKEAIVRHLFQLHDWKPQELREMGFAFKGYRPLIKFRSLRTHNEYLEVLKLRRQAYVSANKIDPKSTDTDLASELDRKSRILVAYHHTRLVGTVSLLFPDHEEMILDTERTFENGYPAKLPSKTKMIEIARLCITSDYRATDILWGMIEHIYRILITSGREYVLSSTDDHMWTLYKQMGFKKVGISYNHPVLKGIEHHVMILNKNSALFGKGVSPFVWCKLYSDMTAYLTAIDAIQLNVYQRARINLNKSLYAILRYYLKLKKMIR